MERDPTLGGTNEYPSTGIIKTSEVTVTRTEEINRPDSAYVVNKKASFSGVTSSRINPPRIQRNTGFDPNKAALKYCKCALLFFVALIITWGKLHHSEQDIADKISSEHDQQDLYYH